MSDFRTETDSLGNVQVPAQALYGAQTQRSKENFSIGTEIMPREIVQAYLILKKASAQTNVELTDFSADKATLIEKTCDELLKEIIISPPLPKGELKGDSATNTKYAQNFPLLVWQTGSGTQTNMNVNEVIVGLAKQINPNIKLHPNDDINKSQSSNDTFPTAMHIAAYTKLQKQLLPALDHIATALEKKSAEWHNVIKIGRTHLMDATPLRLGDEFGGYAQQLRDAENMIVFAGEKLLALSLGGTAVGSGINAPDDFGKVSAQKIANITGYRFYTAANKFASSSAHDALVGFSGTLKQLAMALMKIANDIRWLGSGPRAGLGELNLPANEPGSSIMPGKVNPTQCEAITQVCAQVFGNDATVAFAGSQGNFELNVYKPVMIFNVLQSLDLLTDSMMSFTDRCLVGMTANEENIKNNLDNSLMLVTALNKTIGYDQAAEIAKQAHRENTTLKAAALDLELVSEADFDQIVDPEKMV